MAGPRGAAMPIVNLTVDPENHRVEQIPDQVSLVFTFHNNTNLVLRAVSRDGHFCSLNRRWESEPTGPVPTSILVPASGQVEWSDRMLLTYDLMEEAASSARFAGDSIVLEQSFTLQPEQGPPQDVTTTVTFELQAGWRKTLRTEEFRSGPFQVRINAAYRADSSHQERLARVLAYADSAATMLVGMLSLPPEEVEPIPLRFTAGRLASRLGPAAGGQPASVTVPLATLDEAAIVSPYLLLPQEIGRYLVGTVDANLPHWFGETIGAFLGDLVAERLGRRQLVERDRTRFQDWAQKYAAAGNVYLGHRSWPPDDGVDGPSYGFGYVYGNILTPLLAEHGEVIFSRTLRCLSAENAAQRVITDESERSHRLITCLGQAAGQNLGPWFAEKGIE
jgi:hypothetical protein